MSSAEKSCRHPKRRSRPFPPDLQSITVGLHSADLYEITRGFGDTNIDLRPLFYWPSFRWVQPMRKQSLAILVPVLIVAIHAWTPLADSAQDDRELAQLGGKILSDTAKHLPKHVRAKLNCTSCHLDGGTVAGAAPWKGVAGVFSEYRARSGRHITLRTGSTIASSGASTEGASAIRRAR